MLWATAPVASRSHDRGRLSCSYHATPDEGPSGAGRTDCRRRDCARRGVCACRAGSSGGTQGPGVAFAPAPSAPMVRHANTELGELIDSAPELVVAGERLNVGLLRRFYARHGFEPVWTTRQSQAESLMGAVLRADDHGLAPELFHANLLRRRQMICRRSTGNCCCRTPSCPMPTRWRAGSCRSSAEEMTRL